MLRVLLLISLLFSFFSCDVQGVKTDNNTEDSKKSDSLDPQVSIENAASDTLSDIEEDTVKVKKLDNGIEITWFKKGKGEKLAKSDLIKIDYRNKLEDGTVYDGNHLIKRPFIPFFVGWNQQTPGWDIALEHLRVGDDVDIFIPSELARGKKGIKGLVPPNSNNILSLRVLGKMTPTKTVDDIRIWKVDERKNPGDSIDFKDKVTIDYWVSSESKPRYDNSYQRNEPFVLTMGDGNIVPGLYKALHFGREGDKLMIHIPAKEAYGKKGLVDNVKPNEDIFYDLIIREVEKKE